MGENSFFWDLALVFSILYFDFPIVRIPFKKSRKKYTIETLYNQKTLLTQHPIHTVELALETLIFSRTMDMITQDPATQSHKTKVAKPPQPTNSPNNTQLFPNSHVLNSSKPPSLHSQQADSQKT
jgi:hypothetical protein